MTSQPTFRLDDGHGKMTSGSRAVPTWSCLLLIGILTCPTSEAANGQERKRTRPSQPPTPIVDRTVVNGDIDAGVLRVVLAALPRQPERIVVVDTEAMPLWHEKQLRDLDGFVPVGSRVIYLRRQGPTLRAAEFSGGPYLLMLAAIWHEMAHAEGLDERRAQEREEDLWKQFVQRGLVESSVGLTYLDELRRRR